MMNSKLQAALDELQRLHDTVREYKSRNRKLPDSDSDAGRAADSLQRFHEALKKLDIGKLLERR
jgi:FtsZ-binding cell division protein ZapB